MVSLLLLPFKNVFFLESECIPLYVLAITQLFALPFVFEGVQFVVAEAQVVHSEVDRRPVASRGEHHVCHDLGHVELLSSWEWLSFNSLLSLTASSVRAFSFLHFEVGSNSVLPPELLPGTLRQVVHHFTSESDAGHGVQDGFVGNHIPDSQYLSVKTLFDSVDFWAFPNACSNHGGSDVDEHRSGEAAD